MSQNSSNIDTSKDSLSESKNNSSHFRRKDIRSIPWYKDQFLATIIFVVFAADQISKYAVSQTLSLYESWPSEGLLRFTHGTNSGTIWGLFPDATFVLTILSFIAIGMLYYFYRSHAIEGKVFRLAIGLQLGGAAGNLADRIRLGEVIDFIDVGWWPIFNLADSSIVVGITILMTVVWLGPDRHTESTSGTDTDGGVGV
jgi:signal peptidase II